LRRIGKLCWILDNVSALYWLKVIFQEEGARVCLEKGAELAPQVIGLFGEKLATTRVQKDSFKNVVDDE
jgi:hypothetical protein